MIKHTVCFKLGNNSIEECNKCKDILLSMKDNVPMVRDIEVGIDVLHSARSYDVILQVIVDDLNSLNDYQNDEYHCSVVKKHMHAVAVSSIALDCEY